MKEEEFIVLARLLGLATPDRDAAHAVIYSGKEATTAAAAIVERLRQADAAVRGAYVIHGPMEFRILVGHRDTLRWPGSITLEVGDIVRLVAQSTERWVPVRVTALPVSSADYYSGVVTEQLVRASRYQAGNGVRFSEDQVMVEEPRAASRRHYRRY